MSILVTGGKGFIGARLIKKLVARGESVICLDLKTSPGRLGETAQAIKMIAGDASDLKDLDQIVKDCGVKKIAHMVFFQSQERGVAERPEDPEQLHRQVTVMNSGTFNVFEAARQNKIKRLIYPSSMAYHGMQPSADGRLVGVDETSPSHATELYGIGKHLCEVLASEYSRLFDLEFIALRVPGVYGPGVRIGARGVNLIGTYGAVGRPVPFPYSVRQKLVLAHVDDVAEAFAMALTAEKPQHRIYEIGGYLTTFGAMAKIGRNLIPDMEITFDENRLMPIGFFIDNTRIQEEFGLQHRPLKQGYLELMNLTRKEAGREPIETRQ